MAKKDKITLKRWWKKYQEPILWIIGLLIIIALGLRGLGVI